MFQHTFSRMAICSDGTMKQYVFTPYNLPHIPWKYSGELTCEGETVGEVHVPRHLKASEEYNALVRWITTHNPTVIALV